MPCQRIFFVKLIRWKWNRTSNLTGFLPDIVRILLKYDLMDTLTEYISQDRLPRKNSSMNMCMSTIIRFGGTKLLHMGNGRCLLKFILSLKFRYRG